MSKKKSAKKSQPATPVRVSPASNYPSWFGNRRLQAGLLFCLGFLLYANSLGNEFASDDAIVITNNEFTQQGFAGFDEILSYDTFRGFFKVAGKDKLVAGGRYRPLTLLMFATEYQFFGENPFVGHLVNCLFFGLCGALLYLFLFRLLSPKKGSTLATWVALAASLIFIAHPLHTEAVANIKGRDEIMAFLGGIGALYALLRAWDGGSKVKWYSLSGLFFFLGLLSKEHIITLLAVVPLALYYFRDAKPVPALVRSWPIWAASVLFLILRGQILGWSLGDPSSELMNNPFLVLEGGRYVAMPFGEKYATIIYTLGKYIQLLFVPNPLTHDYYPRHIEVMEFSDPLVLLSLVAHLALLAGAIYSLRRKSIWGFGIWFYLITLSIVSNIVFPVGTNMSERFLFLPSVGFCLAIAALVYQFINRGQGKQLSFKGLQTGLYPILAITILFGSLTVLRNPVWKNDYTLFTTDIKVSEGSAKLQTSVGGQLINRAQQTKDENTRKAILQEAITHLQRSIEIHPLYKHPYHLLGNAYIYLGSFHEAIRNYDKALAIDPEFIEAVNNKGVAHLNLDQFGEAFTYFDKALEINPNYTEAKRYRALTSRKAGQFFGEQRNDPYTALRYLHEAEEQMPNDFETLRLLGVAYGSQQNSAKAIEYFERALPLASSDSEKAIILLNLGTAWYTTDLEKANGYYQQAQALDPNILQRQQATPAQ
ncbi:MAG: tetratricopeptide repeat protein [Saprospiraceae bacterium]|nr:tetratricopeptide repeat protein [Saprospiraceae bacterium]